MSAAVLCGPVLHVSHTHMSAAVLCGPVLNFHTHTFTHTHAWHAETRAEGCIDRTVYGTSRTATTSFFTHHLRLISLAAVIGAALPVAIWAKSRKSHLLSGAPLAGLLPVVM